MLTTNKRFLISVMLAVFSTSLLVTYPTFGQGIPTNDMFASAKALSGSSGEDAGENVRATLEPNEPPSCSGCKTVWYRWTAPANLSITFEIKPGSTDPVNLNDSVLGVYMGNDVGTLTMLTWNDDISAERGNHMSRVTFSAQAGQVYNIRVYGSGGTEGIFLIAWEINGAESWKQFNFDGCNADETRKSDFGIFRPSDGSWWLNAEFSTYKSLPWGTTNDVPVPGDYFGDGCSDIAIWRPTDGTYWILDNPGGSMFVARWGMEGDVPVRGDFDGDDKADLAIWRPSTQQWWVLNSSDGSIRIDRIEYENWGYSVAPITGDYDGDGKTDIGLNIGGVYIGNLFVIKKSSDLSYVWQELGGEGDYRMTGDFDRDGKNDLAVYGLFDNTFQYLRSSDNSSVALKWGLPGDIPVFGDYSGPAGSDLCVWRPSDGNLYCYDPIANSNWQFKWGVNGDKPIAAATNQPYF